jgi:hypothetical protein
MSAKAAVPTPEPTADPVAIPSTEYEKFIAALPESFREECQTQLQGSGLAANHPVFGVLAGLYLKQAAKPARNFIAEVTAHADLSQKLLADLKEMPGIILGDLQPQLLGAVSALSAPIQRLETVSEKLQSQLKPPSQAQVASLPVLTEIEMATPSMLDENSGSFRTKGRATIANPVAWIVTGTICVTVSIAIVVIVLVLGAAHLSHSYEQAYQTRLAHLEADSATNTFALNRLLAAGITLKVEQAPDAHAFFIVLPGVLKAAQPVNSPEGIAVEVWPQQ